jgi:hypothetical protein
LTNLLQWMGLLLNDSFHENCTITCLCS